jgi:hypothetical protein
MRRTGQVECLNLLRVAWVASGVGREWAAEAGQPLASCQAFVERQPSSDAFVAVAAFLAVKRGDKNKKKTVRCEEKISREFTENYLQKNIFHFPRENCVKYFTVQRLID